MNNGSLLILLWVGLDVIGVHAIFGEHGHAGFLSSLC